jgi:hypothetical protein
VRGGVRMGEPDLVPSGERILSSGWHGDESGGGSYEEVVSNMDGECIVVSDRTGSVSGISTVLSNKYLTSDSCGVAQSDRTSSVSDISKALSNKYLTSDSCGVAQSDRTSSVSDISKVLSDKYLTYDSCGVAQSESDYGTMDELCQMRGTDEYECRVERVPSGHQGKVLDGPAYSVTRYYRIVIVLLYVGQY